MRWSATALLLCGAASKVTGQNASALVPCRGQRIDSISVDAQAPTVTGLRRVPVIGNIVREAHVVTREEIVRGFLLLQVGDKCSELNRAESERILRAQPFIADATIDALGNRRGGVDLDVRTIDEASLIGESRGHAQFLSRDSGLLTLGYGQEYAEIGGIARLGPPGKLSLFGLSLTNERAFADSAPARLDQAGLHPDTASEFAGRFME